jgi:ligand-binding sensor domain-containing protein
MSALLSLVLGAAIEAFPSPREARACLVLPGGALVAGTTAGLVTAAAGRTRVTSRIDGLPGTRIEAMLLDRDGGAFWVGTESGLAHVRLAGGRLVVERSFSGPQVTALAWRGETLLVASGPSALTQLVPGADHLVALATAPARITSLAVVADVVYAGTAGAGLLRLGSHGLQDVDVALPSAMVWSLAEEGQRLLVGTLLGLVALENGRMTPITTTDVRSLSVGRGGTLIASLGDGLARLAPGATAAAPILGASGDLLGVAQHEDAACTVGPEGVRWRAREPAPWRALAWDGPPSNDVSALARLGDALVVGTFDSGIAVLEHGRWAPLADPLLDPRINGLAAEGGRLWIATPRGLVRWHAGEATHRFTAREALPSSDVHAVAPLRAGGVVVATAKGAALVADDGVRDLAGPARGIAAFAAVEAPDGTLWIGTSQGLFSRSAAGGWRRYCVASGDLEDDWVTSLLVDGSSLLVGTYAGGTTRLVQRKGVRPQPQQLHGASVNTAGLAQLGDTLLAATMAGLQRLSPEGTWRAIEPTAGLDVTAVAAQGTDLWVATRRGLLRLAGALSPAA